MKKTNRQIVYETAWQYALDKSLEWLDVEPGDYDGSQKCQHIARHRLEFDDDITKIALVFSFVPKSGVNIHFINWNKKLGKYIDHTLGYLSQRNTYVLLEEWFLEDIKDTNMNQLLKDKKEEWMIKLFGKDWNKQFKEINKVI